MARIAVRRSGNYYYNRVLAMYPVNLVAYWPLSESSGSIAVDASGNSRNGAYSNVALGDTGIGDGRTCPEFVDVSNSQCNVYSVSLRDAWPASAGTFMVWVKAPNSIWDDTVAHNCVNLRTNGNSGIAIGKPSAIDQLGLNWFGGGVYAGSTWYAYESADDWIHVAVTWDAAANEAKTYFNGVLAATNSGLGTWSGVLQSGWATIGGPEWAGNLAHAAIWSKALTVDEIYNLAHPTTRRERVVVLGDSIALYWPSWFKGAYQGGWAAVWNRAVGGQSIVLHMAAQVASAANDNADLVIVALGTNENGTLEQNKSVYAAQLQQLLIDHPNARIYCQQVMRKDNGTSKYNSTSSQAIRQCVAEAATERIWTTDCDLWIDGITDGTDPYTNGDLIDSVHLNPVGATKVVAQYVTLLG